MDKGNFYDGTDAYPTQEGWSLFAIIDSWDRKLLRFNESLRDLPHGISLWRDWTTIDWYNHPHAERLDHHGTKHTSALFVRTHALLRPPSDETTRTILAVLCDASGDESLYLDGRLVESCQTLYMGDLANYAGETPFYFSQMVLDNAYAALPKGARTMAKSLSTYFLQGKKQNATNGST